MNFYYVEKQITDLHLSKFLNLDLYSKISFMRSNFKKIIIDSLPPSLDVTFISEEDLLNSQIDLSGIFWCSNIIFLNSEIQEIFIKKIKNSIFPLIFGDLDGYIFHGRLSELRLALNKEPDGKFISLKNETHLKSILRISDFKALISENSQTRYFNEIISDNGKFIKKSHEIEKLESEYIFLKNVPNDLKKYYVKVFDFSKNKKIASYSMEKLLGIDLSITLINGSMDSKDIINILNILKNYFQDVKKYGTKTKCDTLSFMTNKNNVRHDELKSWKSYGRLDSFINFHTAFSGINNLVICSNNALIKNKSTLNKSNSFFSHGDLCFSNMVFSEEKNEITFIDPRGSQNGDAFRSPYYDLAKISHSLLGGYDYIINNITMIQFDDKMRATINFNGCMNSDNNTLFTDFADSLGYDIKLIRIVEASLFLSMLPLHTDDEKKVFMLALRASEILSLNSTGIL